MFECLEASKIDEDGIERVWATVDPYRTDELELGYGRQILLENNYAKNTYEIQEFKLIRGGNNYAGILEKGKEETKTVDEFKAWLLEKGYKDEEYCKRCWQCCSHNPWFSNPLCKYRKGED